MQAAQQIHSVGLLGSARLVGRGLCRREPLRVVDDTVVAFAIVALALLADMSLCRASRLGVGPAEDIDE